MKLLKARVVASNEELLTWGIEHLGERKCFVIHDPKDHGKSLICIFRSSSGGHTTLYFPRNFVAVGDGDRDQIMDVLSASKDNEGNLIVPPDEIVDRLYQILEEE
jgi:hypothetical protein